MEEFGHFGGPNNVDIFRYVDFIFQGFLPTKRLDQRTVVSYIWLLSAARETIFKCWSDTTAAAVAGFVIVNLLQTAKLGSTSVSPPCKQLFDKKTLTHCLLDVVSIRF